MQRSKSVDSLLDYTGVAKKSFHASSPSSSSPLVASITLSRNDLKEQQSIDFQVEHAAVIDSKNTSTRKSLSYSQLSSLSSNVCTFLSAEIQHRLSPLSLYFFRGIGDGDDQKQTVTRGYKCLIRW